MHPPILLLASSDSTTKQLLARATEKQPRTILAAATAAEAVRLLNTHPDLVFLQCDHREGRKARGILQALKQAQPALPVIILGTEDSARAAIEALQAGASNYLPAPWTTDSIAAAISGSRPDAMGIRPRQVAPPSPTAFDQVVSVSPQMQLVKHLAREVAATDATVLIAGESGTGKELFAHAIHAASPRADGPFIPLNCAGIPEHLLESELFGYQRGAFTDAKQTKLGRFQLAEGGTLFLDEIGEMSMSAQAKLLRVLEDHVVDPLGDTHSVKVNIRVITATNEDLPTQIKAGRFRLDLFYRLNVYQLRIPPLRERPEDIEALLHSFLSAARSHYGCRIEHVTPEALACLQRHDWPGNVRELHNVVEGLTITCRDQTITPEHLPPTFRFSKAAPVNTEKPSLLAFGLSFQEMEKRMLEEALRKTSGNVSEASRLLKLTRNTLRYRMAKYHIS